MSMPITNTFLNDIFAQPQELSTTLAYAQKNEMETILEIAMALREAPRVILTSMGSAYLSLIPMYSALRLSLPNVELVETAELLARPTDSAAAYFVMSRSGESREIAELSHRLHSLQLPLFAVTMSGGSTLARNATRYVLDNATFDGFICTKAFSSLALIGLIIASMVEGDFSLGRAQALSATFHWMEEQKHALLDRLSSDFSFLHDISAIYFLYHQPERAVAESGALWVQEAARIPACVSSIAAFTHGPIEVVDDGFVGVWLDYEPSELTRHTRHRIEQLYKGRLLVISENDLTDRVADFRIPNFGLPAAYRFFAPALIVQLLAYALARKEGLEPGDMRYLTWVIQ